MNWMRAYPDNSRSLETFLKANELRCVNLCELYMKKGMETVTDGGFIMRYRDSGLSGVIGTDMRGHIFPCFDTPPSAGEERIVRGFLSGFPHYVSAMGLADAVSAVVRLSPAPLYRKIDYDLMVCNPVPAAPESRPRMDIREAKLKDINEIFPLVEAYEKEEVLLDPRTFNRIASMLLLKKRMAEYPHYMGILDGRVIALAKINAISWNLCQIGGVYTLPENRGMGFAKEIMGQVMQKIISKGRMPVLFVKKDNAPALSLYRASGFCKTGDFSIAYFG